MNKNLNIRFDEEMIMMDIEADSCDEVLEILGSKLVNMRLVKKSFTENVKNRESKYPTGIHTGRVGVAIPHTDTEFVIEASLVLGVLKKEVLFREMATEKYIPVKIIFMIAIKDPNKQVSALKNIISIIQNDTLLSNIESSQTNRDVFDLVSKYISTI